MKMLVDMEVSCERENGHMKIERPHVVVLGAGASLATLPDGDRNGKALPLMDNFHDHVPIGPLLESAQVDYQGRNFETLYSELAGDHRFDHLRKDIEVTVYDYFSSLELPDYPTIYDHLLLCLRSKDVIATFNWDPLLLQAVHRRPSDVEVPKLLFLHGNVLAGYCPTHQVHGFRGKRCSKCGETLQPTPLLYPTADKDYDSADAIRGAWEQLSSSLKNAFMVTVFGYGAPKSDVAAMSMIKEAWGNWSTREMEQFELVNLIEEDQLIASWEDLIHSHHYDVRKDIYDSWAFHHPRRTGEAWYNQYIEGQFIDSSPIPREASFQELVSWLRPLVEAEKSN